MDTAPMEIEVPFPPLEPGVDALPATDDLFPLVYRELRRLASRKMSRERSGHTLQTTGLVHEVYLRLAGQNGVQWRNRGQFLAVAARMMRRILVDHARSRSAFRRGGGTLMPLDDLPSEPLVGACAAEVLAIDEAIGRLAALDPRKGRIVELRFFAGLSIEETAAALGVSPGTVMRDWTLTKAWLRREMRGYSQAA